MKIFTSIMQDPVTAFSVNLTEHMVTWKEETFFEQSPRSDKSRAFSVSHFLKSSLI